MISPAALEDVKQRSDCAEVAQRLGAVLRRSGRRMVGACPMCGGSRKATRFEAWPERWVCAVCHDGGDAIRLVRQALGCDFRAAIDWLGGAREIDPAEARRLEARRKAEDERRAREAEAYRRKAIDGARSLWAAAQPLNGADMTSVYLRKRGLEAPASAMLRHHPSLAYIDGEAEDEAGRKVPRVLGQSCAMVAAVTDAIGDVTAIHITWLSALGGKAMIADPDTGEVLPAKKVRGAKDGGRIVLRAPAPGTPPPYRLFMGEGIETVLSVAQALRASGGLRAGDMFWSAVDLGNLGGHAAETVPHPTLRTPAGRPQRIPGPEPDRAKPAIFVPDDVRELVLLGDGDSDPFLTSTALERARRRFARAGRRVSICMAPEGADFNDVLTGAARQEGAAA